MGTKMNLNDYGQECLESFLNHYFYIPNYQRKYSWEKEQFDDFLADLDNVYETQIHPNHFFGQIVLTSVIPNASMIRELPTPLQGIFSNTTVEEFNLDVQHNQMYQIIDGQQRLTTVFVFLKVLYDKFDVLSNEANGRMDIRFLNRVFREQEEIKEVSIGENIDCPQRLCVIKKDSEWFNNNIVQRTPPEYSSRGPLPRSRKMYCLAYKVFSEYIDGKTSRCNNLEDRFEVMKNIKNALLSRFYVLYLKTKDKLSAFVIFETLNARGKDLAASDLLKNHILSFLSENETELASDSWDEMVEKLSKAEPTKYIRTYWNSQFRFIRENGLFREISTDYNNINSCRYLLNELITYSPVYHDLAVSDEPPLYFCGNDETNRSIARTLQFLNMLRASTFYTIILAMARKGFPSSSILCILKDIEKYIFRNICVCDGNPNSTEVFFAEVARKISGMNIIDDYEVVTRDISREIRSNIVEDEVFKLELRKGFNDNKANIRYFFAKLHEFNYPNSVVNQDWRQTHIEHIMPQNKNLWPDISNEIHEQYLWNLGNLTLLNKKPNIANSNKPYGEKFDMFTRDTFFPTKQLLADKYGQNTKWNETTIQERCDDLVNEAMKVWSIQ